MSHLIEVLICKIIQRSKREGGQIYFFYFLSTYQSESDFVEDFELDSCDSVSVSGCAVNTELR